MTNPKGRFNLSLDKVEVKKFKRNKKIKLSTFVNLKIIEFNIKNK